MMMLNFVFIYFIYMYYLYGNLVSVQLKKGHTFKTKHGEYIEWFWEKKERNIVITILITENMYFYI